MPFSFPSNPTVGQTSTQNGRSYRYAGSNVWELAVSSGGGGGTVTIPAIGDQYWLSTQLLLRGDGSLSDSSNYDRSVTNYGAAATGTAKFGSNSLAFSGSSSYLRVAGSSAFSLPGDFTMEAWVYFNAAPSEYAGAYGACLLATYPAGSGGWQLRINGNATSYTTINLYTGVTDLNWNGTFAINQWHHVAVCRSGSSIRAFLDGVQVGSTQTCSDNMDSYSGDVWVGRLNASPYFFQMNGLLDDVRITKAARYVANFTPPTAALPLGFHTPAQTLTITGSGGGGSGLTWSSVPASATASGTAGQIAYDGSYFYLASATNTWVRAALSTWTPFTPASVTGLQLWLDASDASSLYDATSGGSLVAADGAVARWEDKSGNGRHATQSTSADRPARKTSIQGGKDVLRFDGTSDFMTVPSSTAAFKFLHDGDSTVFLVVKAGTSANPGHGRYTLLSNIRDGASTRVGFEVNHRDSDPSTENDFVDLAIVKGVSGNFPVQSLINNFFASGTFGVLSAVLKPADATSGNRVSVRRNGGAAVTANAPAGADQTVSTANADHDLNISRRPGDAYAADGFVNGDYCEILLYDAALSDTDRAAVESYLMTKWGIS